MGLISDQLHPVLEADFKRLRERVNTPLLAGSEWLLTGATGLVPAYLVRFLSWLNEAESLGLRLHLWVRSMEKARSAFPWVEESGFAVEMEVPDWSDPQAWTVPSVDYLVHAASPATPAACAADPVAVRTCNVDATRALLEGLDASRLRKFLFFSSSEVYGDMGDESWPDESFMGKLDTGSPRAVYPLAKREGENLCSRAVEARELPACMARIFHTYGPGMDLLGDGRVFADFVGNAVRGEDIVLKSDGSGRRAFCYLADTVAALLKILQAGQPGLAYNVGNPEGILSVSELADLIVGLVPRSGLRKRIEDQSAPQSASAEVFPEIAKLRNLGWQPEVSPQDGFARTLEFYLS